MPSPSPLHIRLAVADDIKSINAIYNQAVDDGLRTAHDEPTSMAERATWFGDHDENRHPIFVCELENRVTGWISVSPYRSDRQALNGVIEISYYVDYQYHEQGLGSRLMAHALNFCMEANYRIAVAILISQNKPSLALLDKFGFTEGGRIPDAIHYQHTYRDHLYFYKKLHG
ncbi:MAG: N-acetyltransferase family protein [Fodinibius sp.]|nr:N-acetyltransferase family protein [Fodinibius sp.]